MHRQMKTRREAVAGMFYEADPARLQQQVDALLDGARQRALPLPRGLIVPHAGYRYSGATAAAAYRCLVGAAGKIRRVALLGPAHRVYLPGMALPAGEAFATPLGTVPLDRGAMDQIARLPGVCIADEAHRQEHSLEVQLPFLQRVLGEFALVPVVVGHCPPRQVADVIDALGAMADTLLVVSTDLSHFHDYATANRLDSRTCEKLLARESGLSGEEACGAAVLNGLMASSLIQSLHISQLQRCNSGDTGGDRERVVGYGAFALH